MLVAALKVILFPFQQLLARHVLLFFLCNLQESGSLCATRVRDMAAIFAAS